MPQIDTAMIFAAGLGTRFKPWTDTHPKALARVNGKSLLQRNVEYLAQFGINKIIVNVHHFADQIIDAVTRHRGWGSQIAFSEERAQLLDTGGGMLNARALLEPSRQFVTINADILTDLDLGKLITFHDENQSLISLGVTDRPSSRVLLFDGSWQLRGWKNKQTGMDRIVENVPGAATHMLREMAYSCITVMNSRIFSLIQREGVFSLIDVYLDLAATERIKGYDHSGDKWLDVGRTDRIEVAEKLFT